MHINAIKINSIYNVGIAIETLHKGDSANFKDGKTIQNITIHDDIPFGFKFSLENIAKGESIIKYGLQIGIASQNISLGSQVHVHNCEGARGRGDLGGKSK